MNLNKFFTTLFLIFLLTTKIASASKLSDFFNSFFNYAPVGLKNTGATGFQKRETENDNYDPFSPTSNSIPTIAKYYSPQIENPEPSNNFFSNQPVITTAIPKTETVQASTPLAKILSSVLKSESKTSSLKSFFGTSNPTKKEVQNFQEKNNLKADGIIGKNTIKKIESKVAEISDSNNKLPNGKSKQDFQSNNFNDKPQTKNFNDLLNLVNKKEDDKKTAITKDDAKKDAKQNNENCGKYDSNSPRLICIGRATIFGHSQKSAGCTRDKVEEKNDIKTNGKSASGLNLNKPGSKGIPAVALPPVVIRHKNVSFNTAVEVLDLKTNKCVAFPLLESGPGKGPVDNGVVIDLTGSAFDILDGKDSCDMINTEYKYLSGDKDVKYYVDVTGRKIPSGQTAECIALNGDGNKNSEQQVADNK